MTGQVTCFATHRISRRVGPIPHRAGRTLGLLRPGFDMLGQARAAGNRRIAETLAPERLRGTRDGPRISAGINLFPLLGYGLLIVAVVLVLRVLVVIFRRD